MLPDGSKSLAPSGAAVVGQEFKPDPVALGQPALSLLDVIPVVTHSIPEFAYMRQTVRTSNAAVVAAGRSLCKLTGVLDATTAAYPRGAVQASAVAPASRHATLLADPPPHRSE